MPLDNGTPANIATLAGVSGLEPVAAAAWLHCEGQQIPNPTNPLNVRFWGRAGQLRGPGATGAAGVGFASYSSAAAGLTDAWRMLVSLVPAYGYDAVVAAAAGSDPIAQARAIELSSWAAGHYGGSPTTDGCLRRYFRGQVVTPGGTDMIAVEIRETFPDGPRRFTVPAGTVLRGYATARPGVALGPTAPFAADDSTSHAIARVSVTWYDAAGVAVPAASAPVPKGSPFLLVADNTYAGLLILERLVRLDPAPVPNAALFDQAHVDAAVAAATATSEGELATFRAAAAAVRAADASMTSAIAALPA